MVSLLVLGGGSGAYELVMLRMLNVSETLSMKVDFLSVTIDVSEILDDFLLKSGMSSWGFGMRNLLSSKLSR